jgi:Ca2+-transporting ATPase
VVCGDLLVLHEGDRIAADALLIDGQLEVDESLLTGEAVPVAKLPVRQAARGGAPGGERQPVRQHRGHAGRGRGAGVRHRRADGRGAHRRRPGGHHRAALGAAGRLAPAGAQLGIGAVVLATAQVLLGWWWNGRPLLDSLLSGIALAMAILPEEIPVILTVFLALGAWRMRG